MKANKVNRKVKQANREKLLKWSKTNVLLSIIYVLWVILVIIGIALYSLSFLLDNFFNDESTQNWLLLAIVICLITAIIILWSAIKNCDSLIKWMKKSKISNLLIEEIVKYRDNFWIPILSIIKIFKLRKSLKDWSEAA